MTSKNSERAGAPPRLLRRRVNDRVLGGVAGGVGDYFNIDPLLVRIGFVGLMIFGGAGLVLYLIGWLLLPAEGRDVSVVEGFLRRLALTPRRIGWIALAILVFLLFSSAMNEGGYYSLRYGPLGIPGAIWALGVMVAGVLLLRRRDPRDAAGGDAAVLGAAPDVPLAAPARAVKAPPRPRSPLAWYTVAGALVVIGVLAIIGQVTSIEIGPGQYFGAVLAVLGIGLIVGAWWGRARVLILLALLLLPVGVVASFVTAPLEGGLGEVRYTPANAAELRDEYRLMSGRLVLDLTDLSVGARTVRISASVAVGQLVVAVPEGSSVEVRTRVGAGASDVFGASDVGTSLDSRYVRHHQFGTIYVLDLESGLGEVRVFTGGSEGY